VWLSRRPEQQLDVAGARGGAVLATTVGPVAEQDLRLASGPVARFGQRREAIEPLDAICESCALASTMDAFDARAGLRCTP